MSTVIRSLQNQVALQDALLKSQAEKSLRSFVQQSWSILEPDTTFVSNWHIDYIAEHLEAVTRGRIRRLLINLPPRSMKSILVSVLWPTWEWIGHPGGRWVFVSYADHLASKHSLDRRTVIQSDWYQARWGDRVQLAEDQNVKNEFQNTRRGVMVATSVGGSITGKGGSRIVVDDPHNPMQAESDAQRDGALSFFRNTLATRLDDKKTGAIVVVMQRLHERDLSALCRDLDFVHVCLPAEAEASTTLIAPISHTSFVRQPGDLLWPAREGRAELDAQKCLLGSDIYAAQYQQRPTPPGGAVLRREWWQFYDDCPRFDEMIQSWDMSYKDSKTSDYVVGLAAGKNGAHIYLVDRRKGQWGFNETCRQVVDFRNRHQQTGPILIEDAANGPAIINALGAKVPGIIPVTPEGGKMARAQAVLPLLEAGNIWLPNPRPHGKLIPERAWVDDFLHQCTMFPTAPNDDDVDAFTQLVARWLQPRKKKITEVVWGPHARGYR